MGLATDTSRRSWGFAESFQPRSCARCDGSSYPRLCHVFRLPTSHVRHPLNKPVNTPACRVCNQPGPPTGGLSRCSWRLYLCYGSHNNKNIHTIAPVGGVK
ncbi:hypothetical protein PAXRUDRAFT_729770 [Paxillus rubicundulus Ve08.2h10]|uniref:Uncharacterized protein n=1 Tax=Paxillus rubicundulus Ve08.2h10 TaxID=930991 RepID=A0A0D0DIC1_9AGAM|nr:hypothetical protein PAXRUDRAFT_729770 [Paxillus rubicundulus Ve08.2h10]